MGLLKRLVDLLAPLGFALAVGVLAWARTGRTLPGGLRPWLAAALALVLVHVLLRWEDVLRGLGRLQLRYGTNTAVLVLVVLGILGALNYLAQRHTQRFDLTKDQRYSLSDQTKKVLAGLKDEVKITYFQRQRAMARGEDRLKEYAALSPKLKTEFVDSVQSPAKAQAYDVRGPWPILVPPTPRYAWSSQSRPGLNCLIYWQQRSLPSWLTRYALAQSPARCTILRRMPCHTSSRHRDQPTVGESPKCSGSQLHSILMQNVARSGC